MAGRRTPAARIVARLALAAGTVLALATGMARADGPAVRARAVVEPRTANVGDLLAMTIEVEAPPGVTLEPTTVGPELGPFRVIEGLWAPPTGTDAEGSGRLAWNGKIAAYETGPLELPAIRLRLRGAEGEPIEVSTEPVELRIESVLEGAPEDGPPAEIADLKPPAALAANWRPLAIALGTVLALLAVSALLWWLHRRYAARLAAVPAPEDPFARVPAHVWVYAELQKLLDRRLAEGHQVSLFFEELARIVKLYLGGRYRLDLMEATTLEVPERLAQVGAPAAAVGLVAELLGRCDLVKFAREEPSPDDCRSAIDVAYRIVDGTKPADAEPVRHEGAA
jgi:hypothetical protein